MKIDEFGKFAIEASEPTDNAVVCVLMRNKEPTLYAEFQYDEDKKVKCFGNHNFGDTYRIGSNWRMRELMNKHFLPLARAALEKGEACNKRFELCGTGEEFELDQLLFKHFDDLKKAAEEAAEKAASKVLVAGRPSKAGENLIDKELTLLIM